MRSDDSDDILDEANYHDEKRLDTQADEVQQKNKYQIIKDFSDNSQALAELFGVDLTNIKIHDQLMKEQEKAMELIWDCSAIPEYLREVFWEQLADIETYSDDADMYIRDLVESLLEDADISNPEFAPLLETLKNMYLYARLKK